MRAQKTVSNTLIRNIMHGLAAQGLPTSTLYARSGLHEQELLLPNGRITADRHYRFIQSVWPLLRLDEAFFFQGMARMFRDYPAFLSLCLNCENLAEALHAFVLYRDVVGECDRWQIQVEGHHLQCEYINEAPFNQAIPNFATLTHVLRHYASGRPLVLSISLQGEPTGDRQTQDAFFETHCRYGEARNLLSLQCDWLYTPFAGFNGGLHPFQLAQLNEQWLQLRQLPGMSQVVLQHLRGYLQQGVAAEDDGLLDRLCAQLNMTRWTLRRHLQQESCHFSQLLDKVRSEEAVQLLRSSVLPLQEISDRLGFSSQSAFSRFFRQRNAMTPLQFRRNSVE